MSRESLVARGAARQLNCLPPIHLQTGMQTAADVVDGGGGARANAADWPSPSSPLALPQQLGMDAVRWDGAGEGRGGDRGAAQGGAAAPVAAAAAAAVAQGGAAAVADGDVAAVADGDVAADGEAPSWFRRPRLPRAQRAMLARRMMALTKAIIG